MDPGKIEGLKEVALKGDGTVEIVSGIKSNEDC